MLAMLILPLLDPGLHARSPRWSTAGLAGPANPGPHGFTEILYAYTSATGQQRLGVRRPQRPTRRSTTSTLGLAMLIGRFLMIVPMLAIAGSLAAKKIVPASAGTFPTTARCSSACWSA